MDRRKFIKLTGLSAVGITALGATGLAFRSTELARKIPTLQFFNEKEYSVFAALSKRLLPDPPAFADADLWVAEQADIFLASCEQAQVQDMKKVLGLFDNALAGLMIAGMPTPFTKMSPHRQEAYIQKWRHHRNILFRTALAAMKRLIYATYYASDQTWSVIGYPGPPDVGDLDVLALDAEKTEDG